MAMADSSLVVDALSRARASAFFCATLRLCLLVKLSIVTIGRVLETQITVIKTIDAEPFPFYRLRDLTIPATAVGLKKTHLFKLRYFQNLSETQKYHGLWYLNLLIC